MKTLKACDFWKQPTRSTKPEKKRKTNSGTGLAWDSNPVETLRATSPKINKIET